MSKQSDAKKAQEYDERPYLKVCGNCINYRSEQKNKPGEYSEEKNMRCAIGGFAVKKSRTCKLGENPSRGWNK